jgi:hypothetical protein
MLACRVLGHRIRFTTDGPTMRWGCERCGEQLGEKAYGSPAEAARYAGAFDRKDSDKVGSHPTLSTLPLALARKLRGR